MAKILNLDEILVTEPRELVLRGVTHEINELSTEDYIAAEAKRKSLIGNEDEGVAMRATAELIVRQVPTLTQEQLLKLPIEKLYALAEFVRGVDVDVIVKRFEDSQKALQEAAAGESGEAAEAGQPEGN